ncbi:MAG: hypothetical protein JXQ75_03710, partial [Phycisphaerae bacterium]|nr:hypothetical protein [Phycisphaerae bacterium]
YDEDWSTLYGILGIGGTKALNATVTLFGSLAMRYALANKAEYSNVPLEGRHSAEVEPGEEASFYAEIGAHIQQFMGALFYETMDFSESDVDNGLMQPESEAVIYGIRGGVTF